MCGKLEMQTKYDGQEKDHLQLYMFNDIQIV